MFRVHLNNYGLTIADGIAPSINVLAGQIVVLNSETARLRTKR
jgi:hypothetical protein